MAEKRNRRSIVRVGRFFVQDILVHWLLLVKYAVI